MTIENIISDRAVSIILRKIEGLICQNKKIWKLLKMLIKNLRSRNSFYKIMVELLNNFIQSVCNLIVNWLSPQKTIFQIRSTSMKIMPSFEFQLNFKHFSLSVFNGEQVFFFSNDILSLFLGWMKIKKCSPSKINFVWKFP